MSSSVFKSGLTIETKDVKQIFLSFAVQAQKEMEKELRGKRKKVIVLAGPTGCGKSEVAEKLAREIGGEIISADSMQMYRGMDIGTAKPSKEVRLKIPYHLIDVCDMAETFNVVDFFFEAQRLCQEILDRKSIPIIVGGSGFYLRSLLYGPPGGPPPVQEVREKLEREWKELGSKVLYDRLRQLDPKYASTITKNDKQKIIRALEIMKLTGKEVSKFSWGRKKMRQFNFRCWFLYRPKEKLFERVEKRCEEMVGKGFIDEVRALIKKGIKNNSSACQAIGYRQALEYLDSEQTKEDYLHFLQTFKTSTRRYVKKQLTWFRHEPDFRWLDLDMHDPEIVLELIKKDYEAL